MAIQLYVASQTFELPPVAEEDEMLDFEDIGGIYNDPTPTTASSNTAALLQFLLTRARLMALR